MPAKEKKYILMEKYNQEQSMFCKKPDRKNVKI